MRLVAVYSATNSVQAHLLANLLESNGVSAVVAGEALSALGGYALTGPRVMVHPDEAARAKPIVEQFVRTGRGTSLPKAATPWKCPNCGELIEPQFTDCWNCQTPRQDVDETAGQPTVPRQPPDPQVPIDTACVQCEYNLRGLSLEGRCPECGHPIFPSVLIKARSIEALADETSPSSDVLWPCLDWMEQKLGFAIETIGFVVYVCDRIAEDAKPQPQTDRPPIDYDLVAARLQDLATDYLGDPVIAHRALDRWKLHTTEDLRRIVAALTELRVLRES